MSGYDQDNSFVVVAETRRRWSRAEKLAVVAETAGASGSAVARKHGIASSLVLRWRRGLAGVVKMWNPGAGTAFVPIALLAPPVSTAVADSGMIEIELAHCESAHGRRVRRFTPDAPSPGLHQKLQQDASRIHRAWASQNSASMIYTVGGSINSTSTRCSSAFAWPVFCKAGSHASRCLICNLEIARRLKITSP